MSWQERALRAARDEHGRVQAEAERDAEATVEYLWRMVDAWGVRPTAGTARLGEPREVVDRNQVRLQLTREDSSDLLVELRTEVTEGAKPVVHAWVYAPGQGQVDRGPVETLVDLGHAIDPQWQPDPDEQEDEPNVGELLLSVLQGIVRDVVHDELEGLVGDGPP